MTVNWLTELRALVADKGTVIRVSVVEADGSSPRDVGVFMTVTGDAFDGTIGGGALENEALMVARRMLTDGVSAPWWRRVRDYPLGPDLAQCCGGYVRLLYEAITEREIAALNVTLDDPAHMVAVRPLVSGLPMQIVADRKSVSEHWPLIARRMIRDMTSGTQPCRAVLTADDWYLEPLGADLKALYLYGAGHVGRAVVHVVKDLAFSIHWVDTEANRFPDHVPDGVRQIIAANPATIPTTARPGSFHVVMTFSHVIDFDVCQSVLAAGKFDYLGLIGSKTKRARFAGRLRDAGLDDGWIERMHCPIGVPGLEGKDPAVIAVSLAADLLLRLAECAPSTEGDIGAHEGGLS